MSPFLRAAGLGALFLLAAQSAQAQALKPEETAQIKTEVIKAMDGYMASFNNGDTKSVANNSFTNPGLAMGANGVTVNTPEQLDKQYAGNLARLKEAGWAKSVVLSYEVCVMNPNVAFASSRFNRVKTDGSILAEGATTYMLNKSKDGWRIAMLIGHDRSKTMKCSD
jgi:hypothetical protein